MLLELCTPSYYCVNLKYMASRTMQFHISWLLSFLTESERYVQIQDVDCDGMEIVINSDKLTSDLGVPQGTIIGPTSFISYSND
jgi:hypothetical protein